MEVRGIMDDLKGRGYQFIYFLMERERRYCQSLYNSPAPCITQSNCISCSLKILQWEESN